MTAAASVNEVAVGEWEAAVDEVEATKHDVAVNEAETADRESVACRCQLGHRRLGLHTHRGCMHIALEAGAIAFTRSCEYKSLLDPIVQDCVSYCLAFIAPLRTNIIRDHSAHELVIVNEGIRLPPRHVDCPE